MEAISGVWKFPSRKPGQRWVILYYTAPPHLEGTGMPGFQVDGYAAIKPHRIEEVRRGWWLFSATLLHPVCGHLPSALPFFLSGSSCIVLLFPGGSPLWELGFLFFGNWVHLFTPQWVVFSFWYVNPPSLWHPCIVTYLFLDCFC